MNQGNIDGGKAIRPTRIISVRKVKCHQRGTSHMLIFTCDNGDQEKEYTSKELAIAIGFKSSHGFLQRLAKEGADHPDILRQPKTGFNIFLGNTGSEKYAQLSGRERKGNLKKLNVGSWEARWL